MQRLAMAFTMTLSPTSYRVASATFTPTRMWSWLTSRRKTRSLAFVEFSFSPHHSDSRDPPASMLRSTRKPRTSQGPSAAAGHCQLHMATWAKQHLLLRRRCLEAFSSVSVFAQTSRSRDKLGLSKKLTVFKALTKQMSAMGELVIQFLAPLST